MSEPPTPEQRDEWCKAAGTSDGWLERFAALAHAAGHEQGARAERERCAKACWDYANRFVRVSTEHFVALNCVAVIRALDPALEPEPRR